MRRSATLLPLLLTLTTFAQTFELLPPPARGFTSWRPASSWEHALLSGNGAMGALVMGEPYEETIITSHALVYLPQKKSAQPINQAARLNDIRQLIQAGRYQEAAQIPVDIRKAEGYTDDRDPFIPAFDVRLRQEPGAIRGYERSTDFASGETRVQWIDDRGQFQRRLFVSRADSVIVLSLKGTAKMSGSLHFERRPVEWQQWSFVNEFVQEMKGGVDGDRWLTYRTTFKQKNPGNIHGYEGVGRLVVKGGRAQAAGDRLDFTEADEVLLLIRIRPIYNEAQSAVPALKSELSAVATDYNQLLARHAAIHGTLFNRVKFDLAGTGADSAWHSDELLVKARREVPVSMIERAFDAGRYNILSATGTNPPNLQGIWAGNWQAPWSGSMTHDGNLPTAISGLLTGNMPELMHAYFNYHERFLDDYRQNAQRLYGTRGIHIPAHTTTSGRDTDFNETWTLSYWTGGAGWAANYFFDYYQYTGDRRFLAEHAYPFMKEAALFYEDFLTEGPDGKYVFNPSYSPENNPGNSPSQVALNATMDVMIARQLLRNLITAAETLDTDKEQRKAWERMLDRMPDYQVAPDGTLREWLWPGFTENHKHRHASHLYGLFDQVDPAFQTDPALRAAAIRTIEERLRFREAEGGGEMAFGLVQLGLAAAHLGRADLAHQFVEWLAGRYWSRGMGSYHNVGELFNTDISGGLPYLITQMLAYSEPGLVSLVPAVPAEWRRGKIEGLLLRGGIELTSLEWNGKRVVATLRSPAEQEVVVQFPRPVGEVTVTGGVFPKVKRGQPDRFRLELPAGRGVTVYVEVL